MSLSNLQVIDAMPTFTTPGNTTPGNTTPGNTIPSPEVLSFRYFGIVVGFYAIFIGTIGNALTILAYFANPKLQTTFNLLVVNLSVVDFLSASAMLPFNLAGYIQTEWPFGNDSFTARFQFFAYFSCGYTSVVFLVTITINRFIGIFWSASYESLFRKKRMRLILVFCWTFAPILLIPFLVGTDQKCITNNNRAGAITGFNTKQLVCTFICLKNAWLEYMQFTRILFQFLPLAIMIICYVAIFVKLRQKARAFEKSMTRGLRSASDVSSVPNASGRGTVLLRQMSAQQNLGRNVINSKRKCSLAEARRAQTNKRMVVISVVICVAFMITFLPSVIINILPGRRNFDPRYHMAASNVTWLNSTLNPIVYVFLNPRFRREYLRLIKFAFGVTKGRFVHDSSITSIKAKPSNQKKNSLSNSIASDHHLKTIVKQGSRQDIFKSEENEF